MLTCTASALYTSLWLYTYIVVGQIYITRKIKKKEAKKERKKRVRLDSDGKRNWWLAKADLYIKNLLKQYFHFDNNIY